MASEWLDLGKRIPVGDSFFFIIIFGMSVVHASPPPSLLPLSHLPVSHHLHTSRCQVNLSSLKHAESGSPERWNPNPGPEELVAEILETKQRKKARKDRDGGPDGSAVPAIGASDFYTKKYRQR